MDVVGPNHDYALRSVGSLEGAQSSHGFRARWAGRRVMFGGRGLQLSEFWNLQSDIAGTGLVACLPAVGCLAAGENGTAEPFAFSGLVNWVGLDGMRNFVSGAIAIPLTAVCSEILASPFIWDFGTASSLAGSALGNADGRHRKEELSLRAPRCLLCP